MKLGVISLGCDKATVDSERLLRESVCILLEEMGTHPKVVYLKATS